MTYDEVVKAAKGQMGKCQGCDICNGKACKNLIPGPGAKGRGNVAINNYEAWDDFPVLIDTIYEQKEIDTSLELFGKKFKMPVFAGPVGAIATHYSDKYNDVSYNDVLVKACAENGIAAFTGDGLNKEVMIGATEAIKKQDGLGIPTVKPWDLNTIKEKMTLVKEAHAFSVAMDVDAAGLPFLKGCNPPAGVKSQKELSEIIKDAGIPFIVKGIMTPHGAVKAADAGASAILISNHGGRVLDGCMATVYALPQIVEALDGRDIKIFVDGGIRDGLTVFKALSLGADAVVIARPFVTAVFGGAEEGVKAYIDKIEAELKDTMQMCGFTSLKEIKENSIFARENY